MGITSKPSKTQKKVPSEGTVQQGTGFNRMQNVVELKDYDKDVLLERLKIKKRHGWEQVGEIQTEIGGKNPPIGTRKKRLEDKRDRRVTNKNTVYKVTIRRKDTFKTPYAHQ